MRAEDAVDAVSANAREALAELRQLLQVLGSEGASAPLAPSPTAADIAALVDRVRASGQPVELHVEGRLDSLAPAISQTAYRIIQEGLTNAVRHARGARTEIRVGHSRDRLDLEVVDHGGGAAQPAGAGGGRGLAGLRERVAIVGGTLSTGPTSDGGFAVTASLPTADL